MGNLLSKGASLATETISKSGSKIVSGGEKLLGRGKTVSKAEDLAKEGEKASSKTVNNATKGAEKTAETAGKGAEKGEGVGSKVWKGTKKVGGMGASAVSGLGGAAKKTGSAVLGHSGGLTSMLKYGAIGGLMTMLLNKNVQHGVTNLVSGAAQGLGKADASMKETSKPNTNNGSAMANQQYQPVGDGKNPQISKQQVDSENDQYNRISNMGHDNYKKQAVDNVSHVTQNQEQLQNQNTQQKDSSNDLSR